MAEKKDNLGDVVLVMTTVDRTNRKPVVSVVQYEEIKGDYYITAARGSSTEWIRNIHANPWVDAQVKGKKVHALVEPIIDTPRIADFLDTQLACNSQSTQEMVRSHGLPKKPTRVQLEALAGRLSLYVLHPAKI
jgi:hypothetical protein